MEAQSQPSNTAPAEGDRDVVDRELKRQDDQKKAPQPDKPADKP